ncbi:uncharacterized protein L201_005047 [Kwoniella dendrophila CBS 6074]|uniref:RRM domain-containing protein n=1 Tax=Kwoniella dendrophila CBS 6074 TaxID=1295534 RepID=A0AAX4JZ48_9TREE
MAIPLTPAASLSSQSSAESPSNTNMNKVFPSTPTKTHDAKVETPSPGKGKKYSPVVVRIPTPTSPTLSAKQKLSKADAVKDEQEKEKDEGKSSLNPNSSSFKPESSTDKFLDRLARLSLNATSSSQDAFANAGNKKEPTTTKEKAASNSTTPHKPSHPSTYAPTPSLAYSPYTPSTGHSIKTPYTPTSPLQSRVSGTMDEGHSKGERQLHMAFAAQQESPEDVGRYLLIQQVPRDTTEDEIRDLIQSICKFKAIVIKHIKSKGFVLVAFYDSREAMKLYETLRKGFVRFRQDGPTIQLHCMKTEETVVRSTIGRSSGWEAIWENSVAVIKLEISGGVGVTKSNMQKILSGFGNLQRFEAIGHEGRLFIAEFFDTRNAATAIQALDSQKAGQALISVSYVQPNIETSSCFSTSTKYTLRSAAYAPGKLGVNDPTYRRQLDSTDSSDVFGYPASAGASNSSSLHTPKSSTFNRIRSDQDVFGSRKPSSLYSTASQSGYSTPRSWDRASMIGSQTGYETPAQLLALGRRLHEPGTVQGLINNADIEARARQGQGLGGHWNNNDRKAIPAQNRVFPERILSGLDNRTTVMIKDVPNKLSRQELVDILEEVVPGEYDFVYLRFDFKNCCNVLQVSYADIQGKAALINKFKNSAVMGVIEDWRPQIFYSSGRMKGKPEPFPDSDNLAVRQRSAGAQLAGFSNSSSYSSGYDNQYYDYSSPNASSYGI